MKRIWVLVLGIVLFAGAAFIVFAEGDTKGPELKEVRVINALWAWDPSVFGFMPEFSKNQCFLLTVELPLEEFRGEQIGQFIEQAGSTFELVAAGKPWIKAAVFEAGNYLINDRSVFCFALVIKDQEFLKMEPDQPYLLTINQENSTARWILEKEIRLTRPSRLPDLPVVKTEQIRFTARIDNKQYQLEAMIYRPGAQGRHPLIVMNHGRNGPHPNRNQNEVRGYGALNQELANQGFVVMMLVRRGYGNSDGPDCEFQSTAVKSGLEAAKDIKSAIEFMRQQEYVAGDKVVIMGHSQGGWAALSSAAVKMDGVLGVVNLCGGTNYRNMGLGLITPKVQRDWIEACGELGKMALVPTLWIYSENDRDHPPEYVTKMFAAFQNSGGKGNLIIKPPYGENGHNIVQEPGLFMDEILKFFAAIGME